jgi:tetratricopeptide (TPR) repeat protein
MAKKQKESTEETLVAVESGLTRAEQYIEENQKSLTLIVVVIALIVVGYMAYGKFIMEPKELAAQKEMFPAQMLFADGKYEEALNGDGSYLGFLYIIDEYASTNAANLAYYYTGLSYLRTGKFDDAISYLKKFSAYDVIVAPLALGAIGDAYMELGNAKEAAAHYAKAAAKNKNNLTAPYFLMKAAGAYENDGNFAKAVEAYSVIKSDYKESQQAGDIDKYLARAKLSK